MLWVNRLHFRNFRGDFFGCLPAATVALPLALAFGVASGVGAIAWLCGSICVSFWALLFGGIPAPVSGPTGPMTVVMASVFVALSGIIHALILLTIVFGSSSLAALIPQAVLSVEEAAPLVRSPMLKKIQA